MLRRYRQACIDHVSLTAAAGRDDTATALSRLGWFRRILQPHGDWVSIADGRHGIEAARAGGQMSVSFHFQTATPLLDDLEYVDAFRAAGVRSEEHTSELQSLMRISYAAFCLKK